MTRIALAIDQGTSSTKALVVTEEGDILAVAEHPVDVRTGTRGAVEVDGDALWKSVELSGKRAIAEARVEIDVVGLANQGETVLPWDPKTGRTLAPGLVWQDRRSTDICRRLGDFEGELSALTGLQLDPYFSAPKMLWIREHRTREGTVTNSDSWLLHRLTGEFASDVSTASRTMLLDVQSLEWSSRAYEIFGLDEARPRLVACDEVVGTTRVFGREVPVAGAIVDQQAALWAQDCREAGASKCTFGTGAFFLANCGSMPARSSAGLSTSVAWVTEQGPQWCLDGQIYAVGSAFSWLRQLGLLDDAEQLDAILASVSDTGGVVFVPALAGLGAPHWQPDARAAFVGLSLGTTQGQLVRAVAEGVAFMVADLIAAADRDLQPPTPALKVDGGLTRSRAFMGLQATAAGLPVLPSESVHATALGAADLALRALGGRLRPGEPSVPVLPEASNTVANNRERWRAALSATATL